MGALTWLKISLTESVISAPTPSPGIRVTYTEQVGGVIDKGWFMGRTVYVPPYFVAGYESLNSV